MKLIALSALAGSTAAFPALLNLGGKGSLLDLKSKDGLLNVGDTTLVDLSGDGPLLNLTVLEANAKAAQKITYPAADPNRLSPLGRQPTRPGQSCLPCSRPIPSPIRPREAFNSTVALLPTLQTRTSATLNQPHPTTATPSRTDSRFHQV